jgi:hypothetical protein
MNLAGERTGGRRFAIEYLDRHRAGDPTIFTLPHVTVGQSRITSTIVLYVAQE